MIKTCSTIFSYIENIVLLTFLFVLENKMAYNTIFFQNPQTGQMREAPVGFSWTVFFFSWFPPMFRSDWKWTFIMFLCAVVTWGLSGLVFMFIYNKLCIKELLNNGYKVKSIQNGPKEQLEREIGIELASL